jgi:HAD superfamily hydrolase (TIGR01509 family)
MGGAVLFDWDGTMASTGVRVVDCFRAASRAVTGRTYPATQAEEYEFWRLNGRGALKVLSDDVNERARIESRFAELYDGPGGSPIVLFDGIREAVERLRATGYRIGVVTAKIRRRFEADLVQLGMVEHIDVAVCADDLDTEKPDPEGVLRALAGLGIAADRAVMVGDSPQDIGAGSAAGTATVGVAWGHLDVGDLAQADRIAVAPADIPDLVENLLHSQLDDERLPVSPNI